MTKTSIIKNRLQKNYKKLRSWLKKEVVFCYRLYDKDIPEFPYIIDVYESTIIVYEKGKRLNKDEEYLRDNHLQELREAITFVLGSQVNIIIKTREVMKGIRQYSYDERKKETLVVREGEFKFIINPKDYLDVGLFNDHRNLRSIVLKEAESKSALNLFCYTGSISVYAGRYANTVTSVDLSNTYLEWADKNYQLNNCQAKHQLVKMDCFNFLKEDKTTYDLIIVDPPSFSNSKSIDSIFDVQRDHRGLLELANSRLNKGGALYFSSNLRSFKLDPSIQAQEITHKTIPLDFRDKKIHKCFKILKT